MARKIILRRDYVFNTTFLQDKRTGKLKGRKRVRGMGDKTAVLRVKSDHGFEGAIFGRTKAIRGSKRNRAYTKKLR